MKIPDELPIDYYLFFTMSYPSAESPAFFHQAPRANRSELIEITKKYAPVSLDKDSIVGGMSFALGALHISERRF